jgi:hypothetical protein
MSRLDMLPDRALQLASQVGDNLKHMVPTGAGKWLDAGIKLGAVKAGTRIATRVVRRNPVALAAAAAGAGLLWLVVRQRAKHAERQRQRRDRGPVAPGGGEARQRQARGRAQAACAQVHRAQIRLQLSRGGFRRRIPLQDMPATRPPQQNGARGRRFSCRPEAPQSAVTSGSSMMKQAPPPSRSW